MTTDRATEKETLRKSAIQDEAFAHGVRVASFAYTDLKRQIASHKAGYAFDKIVNTDTEEEALYFKQELLAKFNHEMNRFYDMVLKGE